MPPKKMPKDYQELAQKAGFVWLGPEVKSAQSKTRWRCMNGIAYIVRFNKVMAVHIAPIICPNPLLIITT